MINGLDGCICIAWAFILDLSGWCIALEYKIDLKYSTLRLVFMDPRDLPLSTYYSSISTGVNTYDQFSATPPR